MDKYCRVLYYMWLPVAANEFVTSRAILKITVTSKRIVTNEFMWYHFFWSSYVLMYFNLSQRKFDELNGPLVCK